MKLRYTRILYRFLLSLFSTISYTVPGIVPYAIASDGTVLEEGAAEATIGTDEWDLVVAGTVILETANTYTDGIILEEGASLYLGCDEAAGTGSINLEANNTTLIVN